ncbi:MAG TPA: DUF2249 domain-containing protein [Verrucomicrobiota bacterium]|nr:DUF2249 domain-containing protein [Verrucomicrobiota bacterium]HNT13836.1 DUF2249 domain-containing protein [Verrucomicrobiota bacterium]
MNTSLPSSAATSDPHRDPKVVFDVRPIPGRVKHAQIFQRWLDLPLNGFFVLLNDHDPVPLRYQFEREFPQAFTWEYLERGPEEFRVKITKLRHAIAPETMPRGCGTGSHGADPNRDPRVVFDVRPIPGRVKHAQIFQRWLDLPVGKFFVLLNDHDPVPLRYQFEHEFPEAFSWEYLEQGPEEFRVKITKLKAVHAPETTPQGCGSSAPAPAVRTVAADVQEIDVRGLEPPEPLVRVLDALEALPAGQKLRAHTDREPCHLFGEAKQRGFNTDCTQQPDGSWITVLTRA